MSERKNHALVRGLQGQDTNRPCRGVYRQLWMLQTCLTVLENASSASPSTEEHLIGVKLQARPQASDSTSGAECCQQAAITTPAMLVECINCLAGSTAAPHASGQHKAASGSARGAAFLLDSQGTSSSSGELNLWAPATSSQQSHTVTDCLHAALSALMNLTHNNETGCCMTAEAGGLESAAGLLAALAQSHPSSLARPASQGHQGLSMTSAQLVDSQTSTSWTALSQPEDLGVESISEAQANGCEPSLNALPADIQPCASLKNLLRVCWALPMQSVPTWF